MGNGPYLSDDGYTYRGRGFIQVTGKNNYAEVAKMVGVDFVDQPDLLAQPQYALLSACCFWQHAHLNAFADRDDVHGLTIAINGGLLGFDERKRCTRRVEEMQKIWSGEAIAV